MEQLSIEEKAKRYDEALKEASAAYKDEDRHLKATLERIFPKLKESEDTGIRKVLVNYFKRYKEQEECGVKTFYGIPTDNILAWLEKQSEPKTAAWTPMDEQRVENLLAIIEGHGYPGEVAWLNSLKDRVQIIPKFREGDIIKHKDTNEIFEVSKIEIFDADEIYYHLTNGGCICENSDNFERVDQNSVWSEDDEIHLTNAILAAEKEWGIESYTSKWLKSIKDRVQPKQKWSEEDEKMYNVVHDLVWESYKTSRRLDIPTFGIINDWLKSLRLQPQWKPSLSQLNALGIVAKGNAPDDIEEIKLLYNDLHKLIN